MNAYKIDAHEIKVVKRLICKFPVNKTFYVIKRIMAHIENYFVHLLEERGAFKNI